jgi:hypothetical protein
MELEQLEAKLKEAAVVQLKTVAEAAAKEKVQKVGAKVLWTCSFFGFRTARDGAAFLFRRRSVQGEALVLAAQGGVGYAVDAQLAAGADVNHMVRWGDRGGARKGREQETGRVARRVSADGRAGANARAHIVRSHASAIGPSVVRFNHRQRGAHEA